MIAFELFWRPIYRYWLFYLITFVSGYVFLYVISRSDFRGHRKKFTWLFDLLKEKLDDIFILLMLWVILWWRLGHVLFYERWHYSQNLLDIFKIHQWWMSFVWWICWVVLGLLRIFRKHRLTTKEFWLFGDLILLIVPLWSFLWRIWNGLNQELIWRPFSELSWQKAWLIEQTWLVRIYDSIDTVLRVNINLIQSLWEWLLLLLIWRALFLFVYPKKPLKPGLIAWVYLIGYGLVRFFAETLKDLPDYELLWPLSISQWLTIVLMLAGLWLLRMRTKS